MLAPLLGTTKQRLRPSPAVIFGHCDADGHLAAEQTRTNLEAEGIKVKKIVIGPETRNYRFWERTFSDVDLRLFRLVVIVDIAFDFRNPDSSLAAALRTVDGYPDTHFIVIDHHPLKQPETPRSNLTLIEVDSAYDCCIGLPSLELMALAAICDGHTKAVPSGIPVEFKRRAIGVRRAAADINGFAGYRLLAILRRRQCDFFEALAAEPSEFHATVRGRRTQRCLKSPILEAAKAFSI